MGGKKGRQAKGKIKYRTETKKEKAERYKKERKNRDI
jgi:hypothetical protein